MGWLQQRLARIPRTRGDRPITDMMFRTVDRATPYTRGSTVLCAADKQRLQGYPVHAGIDLKPVLMSAYLYWLPRTRGDRPPVHFVEDKLIQATPYTRGSTVSYSANSRI